MPLYGIIICLDYPHYIYKPHKDDHILTFNSYDGTYSFTYIIFYPSFLHAEEVQKLRNMIEFFDSTNNPSLNWKRMFYSQKQSSAMPIKTSFKINLIVSDV